MQSLYVRLVLTWRLRMEITLYTRHVCVKKPRFAVEKVPKYLKFAYDKLALK